jgi:hypothetical protein
VPLTAHPWGSPFGASHRKAVNTANVDGRAVDAVSVAAEVRILRAQLAGLQEQAHQPPETNMADFATQLRENYYADMPDTVIVEVVTSSLDPQPRA